MQKLYVRSMYVCMFGCTDVVLGREILRRSADENHLFRTRRRQNRLSLADPQKKENKRWFFSDESVAQRECVCVWGRGGEVGNRGARLHPERSGRGSITSFIMPHREVVRHRHFSGRSVSVHQLTAASSKPDRSSQRRELLSGKEST